MRKLLFIVMALSFVNLTAVEAKCDQETYQGYVEEIAESYGICPELIEAMIETESSWNPNARNGKCIGLMQINQPYHTERMERLGVKDLTDAYGNILVGIDYIMELAEQYEDIGTVLNIYNMGNDGAKLGEQGKYLYYTRHVLARAEELETLHMKN